MDSLTVAEYFGQLTMGDLSRAGLTLVVTLVVMMLAGLATFVLCVKLYDWWKWNCMVKDKYGHSTRKLWRWRR